MATSSEQVPDSQNTMNGKKVIESVLDSHKAITLRALDLVPTNQRIFVYILWTLSLFGAISGTFLLYKSSLTYAFVIYIITFGCIIISNIIQNLPKQKTSDELGEIVKGQVSGPSWAREVLRMPIEQAELDKSQLQLRTLRTQAVDFINTERKRRLSHP